MRNTITDIVPYNLKWKQLNLFGQHFSVKRPARLAWIHPIAPSRFLLSTTEGVITTRGNRMKFRLPARPARVSRCRFWVILSFCDSLRWRTLWTLWYEHLVSVLRLFIFSWELSVRVYLILIQKVSKSCFLMLDKYWTVVHQSGGE